MCETNNNITNNITTTNDVGQGKSWWYLLGTSYYYDTFWWKASQKLCNYILDGSYAASNFFFFKLSRLHLTKGSKYLLYSGNTSQVLGFVH